MTERPGLAPICRPARPTEGGPREFRIIEYEQFANKFDDAEQEAMAKEEARRLPRRPVARARARLSGARWLGG